MPFNNLAITAIEFFVIVSVRVRVEDYEYNVSSGVTDT